MDEKNVGALPVVDHGRLVGIVSERDYTRKVITLFPQGLKAAPVILY
jgi:CBS domain-containing protein